MSVTYTFDLRCFMNMAPGRNGVFFKFFDGCHLFTAGPGFDISVENVMEYHGQIPFQNYFIYL